MQAVHSEIKQFREAAMSITLHFCLWESTGESLTMNGSLRKMAMCSVLVLRHKDA